MKSLFSIILSILLVLPTFGSFFVYTQFKINQDEIAKTICIQRANIYNACNGRCELQKSLKKFDDNEKKMNNTNLKEKSELVYTAEALDYNIAPEITIQKKKTSFPNFCKKTKWIAFSIFHPPLT